MQERGVRQQQFCAAVGTTQGYLSQILAGLRRPSPELARRISTVTGRQISVEELLTYGLIESASRDRQVKRITPAPARTNARKRRRRAVASPR